jgi:hypothetical protein
MYKPVGIVVCIFIILLISTSGCSILSSTPKSAIRPGASGETSLFETPALPDQYTARVPQSGNQNPAQPVAVTPKHKNRS